MEFFFFFLMGKNNSYVYQCRILGFDDSMLWICLKFGFSFYGLNLIIIFWWLAAGEPWGMVD